MSRHGMALLQSQQSLQTRGRIRSVFNDLFLQSLLGSEWGISTLASTLILHSHASILHSQYSISPFSRSLIPESYVPLEFFSGIADLHSQDQSMQQLVGTGLGDWHTWTVNFSHQKWRAQKYRSNPKFSAGNCMNFAKIRYKLCIL